MYATDITPDQLPFHLVEVKKEDGEWVRWTCGPLRTSEEAEAHRQKMITAGPPLPPFKDDNTRVGLYTEDHWKQDLIEEIAETFFDIAPAAQLAHLSGYELLRVLKPEGVAPVNEAVNFVMANPRIWALYLSLAQGLLTLIAGLGPALPEIKNISPKLWKPIMMELLSRALDQALIKEASPQEAKDGGANS